MKRPQFWMRQSWPCHLDPELGCRFLWWSRAKYPTCITILNPVFWGIARSDGLCLGFSTEHPSAFESLVKWLYRAVVGWSSCFSRDQDSNWLSVRSLYLICLLIQLELGFWTISLGVWWSTTQMDPSIGLKRRLLGLILLLVSPTN